MKFVDKPVNRPHTCAVIPGRGPATEKDGFIDTHNELTGFDPHVYISMAGAREIARFIGWTSPDDKQDLEFRLASSEKECQRLQEELSASEAVFQAIDALESEGFRARKKFGRPKSKQTEKAA